MTSDSPNIYQRINMAGRILQENPWIKDLTTSQYKSVDIDQIRKHVGAAEVEAGIVVRYVENIFEQTEINGKHMARISATLIYINVDRPEDTVEFPRSAIAWDSGDKGFNKAESMLYKNLYKGLYHIGERAEDPDSFSVEEQELLTHFKNCDPATRIEVLTTVKRVSEAMQAKAKKERRKEKAQQADMFFKPTQKPAETEVPSEPSEFVTADEIPLDDHAEKAKGRRASVNIAQAKGALARLRDSDDTPMTLTAYLEIYGPGIGQWSDKEVIDCYLDLQDEGVL